MAARTQPDHERHGHEHAEGENRFHGGGRLSWEGRSRDVVEQASKQPAFRILAT
jgi:hypothetical protein